MTILEKTKKRLQAWHERRAAKIEQERQKQLDVLVRNKIQVMEYNGDLYLCIDGVPLLGIEDLKDTLTKTVNKVRGRYKDWD